MGTTEAGVLIVAVLALVAIFFFLRNHQRARVRLQAGKIEFGPNASNDPPAAMPVARGSGGGGPAQHKNGEAIWEELGNRQQERVAA
jgi:hypothetical protein